MFVRKQSHGEQRIIACSADRAARFRTLSVDQHSSRPAQKLSDDDNGAIVIINEWMGQ